MELAEELNKDQNLTAVYSGTKEFKSSNKAEKFTDTLQKLLNRFDSEELMIKKVVETALNIEFSEIMAKKNIAVMVDIISGIYLEQKDLRKELIYTAKSIIKNDNNTKIIIN